MEISINYWAVLVAGIASMAVGFVWYGILFRKQWMSLMNFTLESMREMKMSANKAYLLQFIASLVMAWVLAHLIQLKIMYLIDLSPFQAGLYASVGAWLGFVVPVTLGVVLWENKPWKLWLINASNYLVALVVMGIILSLWS
jgi:hypothetical protein